MKQDLVLTWRLPKNMSSYNFSPYFNDNFIYKALLQRALQKGQNNSRQ